MTKPVVNANQKIRLILEKILEEYELGSEDQSLTLGSKHFLAGTGVDDDQFIRMLGKLKSERVLASFFIHPNARVEGDLVCFLRFPASFKADVESYIEVLSMGQPTAQFASSAIIYLDNNGDLWHGNKEDYCYPMGETGNRLMVIRYLAENPGFQSTDSISSALGNKNNQGVRTEFAKIRQKISNFLKIDDFIESKKDSGYRINPKYKVVVS